ncbi:MAG: hypothetical protein A2Y33_08075 [Spirochaetes bacterium GWF1_51_8]|nr:MAG: hypothetical protein A2Y33_08075 [Spirochaetes bacterium GWF1_51_8]
MKRFFAVFAALMIAAGLLSSCAGGGDWKAKVARVEQASAEMKTILMQALSGEAFDEKKAEALEAEITKLSEELKDIYPTLSDADKKELETRMDAAEKLIDLM